MDKAATRQDVIDECCALIKAADDAAADSDYMLDSDDCIKVLRGTWGGPLANDMPTSPRAPQPPSASGEYRRGLFEAFHLANMTNANRRGRTAEETCSHLVRRLAELANNGHGDSAALAPSPGIDAAEQKPVAWMADDGRVANAESRAGMHAITQASYCIPLYAAPPAAQPSADDPQFPFYELRFIMRVLSHQGSAPKEDWQTAYGMARQVFEQWSKDRKAAEWLAEAERLVDFYAESFSNPTDSGKCRQRLAALLAHLRSHHATT